MTEQGKCPVMHHAQRTGSFANQNWWPNLLNLKVLHQNPQAGDPNGEDFDYAAAFNSIDYSALKEDLATVMTDSQDWWPADWGNYAGLMVRMAWHSAGTYRVQDGRGGGASGTQRFAPLNSWPDNVNLDKARRLLWPVKKKYGRKISWADLMILAGNVAMENAGFKTFGFAGGREDVWEPEEDIDWGPETTWLGDERYSGDRELADPLGAVQMGLIYVNPEGPNGEPDPVKSGRDIRETFSRMAMNSYETVALIAGGHTFGKCHGAGVPDDYVGREPEAADLENQGFGWSNTLNNGVGENTISSGIEGAWTKDPTKWDHNYFENLFEYEWELTKSPAGAHQWVAVGAEGTVPAPHPGGQASAPIMTTADMSLRMDPEFEPIARHFYENPEEFADAYAKAWFKLTHRDMGPVSRYLGPEVPNEVFSWQDPLPEVDHDLVGHDEIAGLKQTILDSGLSISQLVNTAWASASTYRDSDKRGGANGARIRLEPMNSWRANAGTAEVISKLEQIQQEFNDAQLGNVKISLADMIVLGGCAAVEAAARNAGFPVSVPFAPGRTDATQDQTEIDSFSYLEPRADGFRNYDNGDNPQRQEELLVDKAQLLSLTAPEMTVLVGGMRALNANTGGSNLGVFTDRPGELTNDFFVNLLDMGTAWERTDDPNIFVGKDRNTGATKWKGSRVDLVFGSNSQLRALAEVYACDDAREKFVNDFVYAWDKVMNLDRFDLD